MRELNSKTAPKTVRPERIIQFGEGNFLRAFVDWIISSMNERSDFNGSVVVVQPIEKGMVDVLNRQDGLYHVNLQGLENGQVVNTYRLIDVISRALNPYSHFDEYMKLAEQPEIRFVVSNTTEAGIAFDPACRLDDRPAASYPGKLTQLLYHRFRHFHGDKSKGLIIFPCELIFQNGHHLKRIIRQYIDLWQLGEDFATWFEEACGVYATLVQLSTYLFSSLLIQIQELQKKKKTLNIIRQNFTALLNAPQISNNDISRTVASSLQH